MDEQKPEPSEPGGGYRRNWLRYLVIYLIVGAIVYFLIYLLFLRDGGLYG